MAEIKGIPRSRTFHAGFFPHATGAAYFTELGERITQLQ
jgi:hypothetical protein